MDVIEEMTKLRSLGWDTHLFGGADYWEASAWPRTRFRAEDVIIAHSAVSAAAAMTFLVNLVNSKTAPVA